MFQLHKSKHVQKGCICDLQDQTQLFDQTECFLHNNQQRRKVFISGGAEFG